MTHITNPLSGYLATSNKDPVDEYTVSTEDGGASLLVGFGIGIAIHAFAKFHDSTGRKHYNNALTNFRNAQKTNFAYGLDSAIRVTDQSEVKAYLKQHRDGKFKQLFGAVENLIDNRKISLNIAKNDDAIAKFIAEDIARYPVLRPSFDFKIESALINTNNPEVYDKIISLLDEIVYDSNYGPWTALTKGWERLKDRIENLYKILHQHISEGSVRNNITLQYNSKDIGRLALIETKYSDNSFVKRKNKQIDSWFIKHMPHFSGQAKESKHAISDFYSDVADIFKEVINSNAVIADVGLANINKYQEEIIKLTKSKDFKLR